MKFRPGTVLSALLIASVITAPLKGISAAQTATPQNVKHLALVMLSDIEASAAKVLAKVDSKTLNQLDATKTAAARKDIADQIAATKTSSAEVEKLRTEARTTAVAEAKRAKTDLLAKLANASMETLDRYAAEMKTNPAYDSFTQEYNGAYTQNEKSRVLSSVVVQDMDQVLTMTLKRLNWMNADGLRADLTSLQNRVFGGKGDGAKIKRILLIAGAAVAFVGLATWGVTSAKYAKIRNGRRDELEGQFQKLRGELKATRDSLAAVQKAELDTLVAKLTKNYNDLNIKLTNDELTYLNTNGYVRMQCNSYTQVSSIICNKYNYQVFHGSTTCTVMCYKNVVLNRETLFEAPVCTSPYIPSDCFSQQMYDAEYNSGYNRGYADNRPIGERDGRAQGSIDGHDDGAYDGDKKGYDDGYYDGDAKGDSVGYTKGYNDGYAQRYNTGYEDGYNKGFDDGYAAAIAAGGFASSSMKDRAAGSLKLMSTDKPQFKKGYDDGFRDAKLVLDLQSAKGA